ncbi:MAG: ergothioneine biosynthesis protein EgtB, partial [Xanthomonadales bacterium]|nr:ergothioneine biosynthesis protein EgtB [Xanthomonadales bacterium]
MSSLLSSFRSVRTRTTDLCRHLEPEDFVVQSMPDASPAKWHLAHTSWFFEHFVLRPFLPGYRVFNERFHFLFNSYYNSVGNMHPRPERGLLSRPLVREVLHYRAHVDESIDRLLEQPDARQEIGSRVVLGLNHEQQHQELLLTDIKSAFFLDPALPAVNSELKVPEPGVAAPLRFA